MTKKHLLSTIATAALLFAIVGAVRYLQTEATRHFLIASASADTTSATRAVQRLHGEGLVMDPEVRDTMVAAANRYQAGQITRNQAGAQVLAFLERWEKQYPERAAQARERFQFQQKRLAGRASEGTSRSIPPPPGFTADANPQSRPRDSTKTAIQRVDREGN